MREFEDICDQVVGDIPGAVSCAIVRVEPPTLLGLCNHATQRRTLHQFVTDSFIEMFRNDRILTVAKGVRAQRGVAEDGEYYFREIQIVSDHNLHFAILSQDSSVGLMLITRKATPKAAAWEVIYRSMEQIVPLAHQVATESAAG
jgi:hypothetical protein